MKRPTTLGISAKEVLFIINPNSGRGRATQVIEKLQAYNDAIAYVVTPDQQAAEEAFKNLDKKYRGIVVVGGDGTINIAIGYLAHHPEMVLGVVPFGSGNGFARTLGFDGDIKRLMDGFASGVSEGLDVLDINGEYAINVSGIGIDSYVAHQFQKSKRRGFITYLFSTMKAIIQFRDFEARISTEDGSEEGKYRMIAIANTKQFGNNAIIAPNADPSDGLYDLVLVRPFPFWQYPNVLVKLFKGKLTSSKYIKYLSVDKETKIRWAGEKYHLDGEPKKSSEDLKIKIKKGKIKIVKIFNNNYK